MKEARSAARRADKLIDEQAALASISKICKVKEEQLEAEGPPTELNPFRPPSGESGSNSASKVKTPKAKPAFKSRLTVQRTLEEAVRNMDDVALFENLTSLSAEEVIRSRGS